VCLRLLRLKAYKISSEKPGAVTKKFDRIYGSLQSILAASILPKDQISHFLLRFFLLHFIIVKL